ncbi:nucleoside deaminase [Bradyrhizobium japonicum]|uniref:nucleoside deaminase n=1 Tax=Bradyrhizobium japonicum TaxID=375 RepID=UPI0035142609
MSRSEADVQDLRMIERCLELARQGVKQGELPFGAVIAYRGQVIAEATNHVSSECDVTRHAELVALSEAQKTLRQKRLPDCTLYSIVEPCPMCSFPAREGADWSRGVRHFISDHGRIFEMGRSVGQQFVEQTA